jgi:hypothetical protein
MQWYRPLLPGATVAPPRRLAPPFAGSCTAAGNDCATLGYPSAELDGSADVITEPMGKSLRPILPRLLAGTLLLVVGLGLAATLLPEGRVESLPSRQRFAERFQSLARRHRVELAPGAPRVRLTTSSEERGKAYTLLGEGAEAWLAERGRGLQVEVSQSARWGAAQGRLQITFSGRGEAWRVEWMPLAIGDFFAFQAEQPEALCGLLLQSGETLGEPQPWSSPQQGTATALTVVGSTSPAHLYRLDPVGSSIACTRRPGTLEAATADGKQWFPTGAIAGLVPRVLFFAAVCVLFAILALRGRVDLSNAAVLAGIAAVSTLLGEWPASTLWLFFHGIAAAFTGVWLLLLWASGESWARVHLPGFTTSLDTLRRGRLGRRGGRALLEGWAGGAALAGLQLTILAAAAVLPGVAPGQPAAAVPLFAWAVNPFRAAPAWTAVLLVALVAGHRLVKRAPALVAALVTAVLVSPVELRPWWLELLVSFGLSAVLVWIFRRGGLTAALVAAGLSTVLPASAFALRHADWLPGTAAFAAVLALAPLVLGFLGIRRGDEVERDPGAVPEFLRREEREKRLSYEMDLLARMQLGLLPQSLPRMAGYEVTARSLLATEAGGDLYDFQRDDRGRLWIAAGDVSGHGYSCAIGQASVKASLLSLIDGNATPGRVLERVDKVLRSGIAMRQFATLSLLVLEEATGRVLLANAGHPFPMLAEPGKGVREIEHPGLPLGQGPMRKYRDIELFLPRGSVLLLYSDGLYEAMDPDDNPYGFERTKQVLGEAAMWNAAEVLERLIWDWRRHLAGTPSADDTTLVVLKRH